VKLLCFSLLSLSLSAFAAPDYSLLKDVAGVRSVLKWNGAYREGTVEVVASDAGIGFTTVPLTMGTTPVLAYSLITSSSLTTLTASGNVVTQVAKVGVDDIKITYEIDDGYYMIRAQDCTSASCRAIEVIATMGKAPGDMVTATPFLTSLQGNYDISLAGGARPIETDAKAEVDTTSDPKETAFYFPYCTPAGCDLGYAGFPYVGTNIFHENLGTNHDIYTLLKYSSTNQLLHYSWEVNNGTITYANHQYQLTGKTVCLEHVVKKSTTADEMPRD